MNPCTHGGVKYNKFIFDFFMVLVEIQLNKAYLYEKANCVIYTCPWARVYTYMRIFSCVCVCIVCIYVAINYLFCKIKNIHRHCCGVVLFILLFIIIYFSEMSWSYP